MEQQMYSTLMRLCEATVNCSPYCRALFTEERSYFLKEVSPKHYLPKKGEKFYTLNPQDTNFIFNLLAVAEETLTSCDLLAEESEWESEEDCYRKAFALCAFLKEQALQTSPDLFLSLDLPEELQIPPKDRRNKAYYQNELARILQGWCMDRNRAISIRLLQEEKDALDNPIPFMAKLLKFPVTKGKCLELRNLMSRFDKTKPLNVTEEVYPIVSEIAQDLLLGRVTLQSELDRRSKCFDQMHVINSTGFINKNYDLKDYHAQYKIPYTHLDFEGYLKEDHFISWSDDNINSLYEYVEKNAKDFKSSKVLIMFLKALGYVGGQRVVFLHAVPIKEIQVAREEISQIQHLILGSKVSPSLLEARDFIYRVMEFGTEEIKDYLRATLNQTEK